MRIFVAGATGVVGRRAVPALITAGHQVTAIGRNPERSAALARAGATVVRVDLFDRDAIRRAVVGHDVVINLATHIPQGALRLMLPGAFRENDRIRREGSAVLADAVLASGAGRFIQESFAPVYEDGGARWLDEGALVRTARYNRTVLDAERSAERVTASGRSGVVLRFAYFYGPDATYWGDVLSMLRRGIAPYPGRMDGYVSSVSHDDAARAVVAALDIPAGVYNVSDDEPLMRRDYFAAMADAFGLPHPKPMPGWMRALMGSLGELLGRSERISNRALRAHGWAPRYASVREGFRAAVAAMRAPREREEVVGASLG